MADRSVALTTVKGGINRLRTKGGALNESLYDLLNAYVTAAKTVKVRPGTFRVATLPTDTEGNEATKGLVGFDDTLHVFSAETISLDIPVGVTLHILRHPLGFNEDGSVIQIREIHFAAPFLGFLYVVVEFEEVDTANPLGNVFHYWLQTGETWEPDTVYHLGDIVHPTTANGFSYQATRLIPANPSWAPDVPRAVGDIVEPTVYNDFFYTVVDTLGDNPVSGTVEPVWPTEDGAQIFEDAEGGFDVVATPTTTPDPDASPNPTTQERYRNGAFGNAIDAVLEEIALQQQEDEQ